MAVLPPQTDDFVINGGFAAIVSFSIILTIYLMRYRFRLERDERRMCGQAPSAARPEAHMGLASSAAHPEAHTGLASSAASAGTSVPVPMCGNERRSNAVLMSGTSRRLTWDESRTWDERRTWGQARPCRLRDTGCQTPSARYRVVAALGQLFFVLMLAVVGLMCRTRGSALAQTGAAWSDSITLPGAAGTYYLTTDVTIGGGGIWIVPSGGVTLDLNGHNVTGCQFKINSGVTLTVKNSGNSGEITFETWPIEVNGGSFYFEGGTLTTSGDNWIVEVKDNGNDNGNFYMSGGTITGGTRGVYLQNQSYFAMTGGEIINSSSYGVVIRGDSTAAISGGEISGHGYDGIRAVSGEVTMSGGVIKGNDIGIVIGNSNNQGTLNLSGGTITGNTLYGINYRNGELNLSDAGAPQPTVTGNGNANVRIEGDVSNLRINVNGSLSPSAMLGISMAKPGVFTNGLNNRGTSANFSSDDSSYAVRLTPAGEAELGRAVASITSGGVTNRYARLQDAMDAAQPNDTILLLDDINASTDTFPILVWKELITLDLNGKTISGSSDSSSGDLIQIYRMKVGGDYSYGQLTLNNGSAEKSGEIVCDPGGCENVINIVDGPNVLTMYGGKISGGTTNVKNTGKFVMNGGEISGRTTNVNSSGQFVMSGGKISGGTTNVICGTSCSMTGGEISSASGNGVTLDGAASTLYLSGGSITDNGQYAIEAFANSIVYVAGGNPITVSRGFAESSRGIYLHEGSGISIYNTPAAGSAIGVTLESGAGVAARGRSKAPTEADLAVFNSDEGYAKFLNTTKKAIVFGYQISYDAGGAAGVLPDALNLDPTDTTADPKVPDRGSLTKTGYSFTGWKDEKGNDYAAGQDFKTLIAQYKPSGSVKLTAQWEAETYAVTLETYGGQVNSGAVTQYTYGIGAALPTDVTWDNYIFSGWYDNVEFSGDPVEQISASDTGEKTFYAQWKYTVRFYKNDEDAQGTMDDQIFIYNGTEQALRKNSFTREGYIFTGWSTVQDPKTQSGGAWYWDEMSVRNLPGDGIVTLYAQWEPTTVRIRKVDEDGYEIGGAVVSIFETLSGKPFGTEQTYDPARGDVIFEGLSIGVKYTVHEVKAPRGYSLAEDKTFVLDEYGFIDLFSADTTVKLIDGIIFLENEPTKVYVRKTDSQSGARLADAQLQLLNTQDGTVSWTSSGTDDREFSGLATGEVYTLHEAAAPSASYAAADDAVFVLDADGSIDPDLTTADYTMEGNNIILLVENVRLYTITFVNEDDSVLESEKWAYGSMPHYTGTLPEKPADVSHSYTFAGWSPHITTVSGDATYKATYTSELNNYTVRFVDEDGTELQTASYAYGTPAADVALPADPTKTSTAQYDYRFAGWTPDIAAVTGNAEYRASYTPVLRQYTVTFVNEDNSVLESGTWDYGSTPHYVGTLPEKPADVSHSYTFAGWDPAVTTVTGDATYKAKYDQTVNTYLVTFVDEDGTELQSDRYAYGTPAADIAQPANPTKTSDAQYTYSFAGWTPDIKDVSGDATYQATYDAVLRQYTVTFLNEDGTELQRDLYAYGTLAANIVRPANPTKTSDAQYTYNFAGWTPAFANVTGNAVYRASYDAVLRQYTVTFVNEDNTELQSGLWDYGATPVYHGEVPTKPADVSHTYHFAGWDPEIAAVTGDATYTAAYSQTENLYKVIFVDEDGTVLKEATEYPYGTKAADIVKPDDPVKASTLKDDYTFAGWTPAITDVTGDVTYRASYNAVLRQYTVRFVNEDNTELQSGLYDYGVTPVYHGITPSKPADASHSYHFAGWTPAITSVTGDATYTAAYSQTENLYKITFVDEDGTVLKETEEYPYGTKAADIVKPDDPVKASTAQYDYAFAGWTPSIADVTGDATYRATYTAVLRQYTVRFINDDGTTLQSGLWNYGVTPVYHGEVPTKRADVSHSYHFAGWSPAITPVTRNTVYTAAYSQTENLYTVTFVDEDGTVLKEAAQYPYGTKAVNIAKPDDPVKPSTAQYEYTFTGWDPAIADVTEDAVYTAAYKSFLRQYTVRFVNEDNTELESVMWDYGEIPIYTGETPAKEGESGVVYTFIGWTDGTTDYDLSDPLPAVTGDVTYTARFTSDMLSFTVTWKNWDGTVLETDENVPYGTTPTYNGETPKREEEGVTYTFDGWEPEVSALTEDAVYTAKFTSSMTVNVEIHNFTRTGAKGIPSDIRQTEFNLTIVIKDAQSGKEISRASNVVMPVFDGTAKVLLENVVFDRTVEELSSGFHKIEISGFPVKIVGAAPMSREYTLSYNAWVGGKDLITVYLKWDDGLQLEKELIRIYTLPEDEIGAYKIREDGTKEYLLFHTYDICMQWLGSDELCRGYERCFHKENPYVNPFVKGGELIEEHWITKYEN